MKNIFGFFCLLILFTGCYRLPEEGEVSTVPNTNNPSVYRQERGGSGFPGIG